MSYSYLLSNFIAGLLLPPLALLLLGGFGLALLRRRRRIGLSLLISSLISIWLLSTPLVAALLLDSLKPPPHSLSGAEADAIVILGGGRVRDSIEYGGDSLGRFTLERLRYGAWLARKLGKPVLVTGGAPGGGVPEGDLMRDSLKHEFGIKTVRWVESASINTRENARLSAQLLRTDGIERIYLVTHAWHLARAVPEFTALGFQVIPAGTGYSPASPRSVLDLLPNGMALEESWLALHEWLGQLWYRIRN